MDRKPTTSGEISGAAREEQACKAALLAQFATERRELLRLRPALLHPTSHRSSRYQHFARSIAARYAQVVVPQSANFLTTMLASTFAVTSGAGTPGERVYRRLAAAGRQPSVGQQVPITLALNLHQLLQTINLYLQLTATRLTRPQVTCTPASTTRTVLRQQTIMPTHITASIPARIEQRPGQTLASSRNIETDWHAFVQNAREIQRILVQASAQLAPALLTQDVMRRQSQPLSLIIHHERAYPGVAMRLQAGSAVVVNRGMLSRSSGVSAYTPFWPVPQLSGVLRVESDATRSAYPAVAMHLHAGPAYALDRQAISQHPAMSSYMPFAPAPRLPHLPRGSDMIHLNTHRSAYPESGGNPAYMAHTVAQQPLPLVPPSQIMSLPAHIQHQAVMLTLATSRLLKDVERESDLRTTLLARPPGQTSITTAGLAHEKMPDKSIVQPYLLIPTYVTGKLLALESGGTNHTAPDEQVPISRPWATYVQPPAINYVYAQPAQAPAPEPPPISQAEEKAIVAKVRQEVQTLLSPRNVVMNFSRTEYTQIADQVYATLVRRMQMEKERLSL